MMIPPKMLIAVMIRPATASPRTNFEAPSMAPKNALSSSSSRRRRWASLSSIRPADRSASIAICLPGMASRVKRAPTSAIRVAPFVITTKFTVTRIAKMIRPMTKSPPMTNFEKPATTWPAAFSPSPPRDRMRRVVATLSASRRIVAISSTVGKAEKSSGRWIHRATMRISAESAIENARPRSIRIGGIGRNRIVSMATMPPAKKASAPNRRGVGRLAANVSAMGHRQRIRPVICRAKLTRGWWWQGRQRWPGPSGSEAVLDVRIDHLGEGGEMGSDEGAGDGNDHENDDDLRNEGQRHLLDLGQRLDQRDDGADQHRGTDGRPGGDDDGPDRRLDDVEGIPFVHDWLIVRPGPIATFVPFSSVAMEPSLLMETEATLPLKLAPVESVKLTVFPISPLACDSDCEDSRASSLVLVCIACSTDESCANWLIYCEVSIGLFGS